MERLVLYVDDTPGLGKTAAWTLELARQTSGRVFAVSVINPTHARGRRNKPTPDAEERAWELLYGVEDDAFEMNVRISLMLEQGDPLERLASISQSYEADVVIASADCRLLLPELLKQSPRPVVFVK